ncbi:MAG: CcmD family protein [Polyangiaceae bacterium]
MQAKTSAVHDDPGLAPGFALPPAAAQPAPFATAKRPEDRSTEFVAVEGGRDTTSAGTLLVSAYMVIWVLLLGFLYLGWRRSQQIEARLTGLEKALEKHEADKS